MRKGKSFAQKRKHMYRQTLVEFPLSNGPSQQVNV